MLSISVDDFQLEAPVLPLARFCFGVARAHSGMGQDLEQLGRLNSTKGKFEQQQQGIHHVTLASNREVNHVEWDSMQLFKDCPEDEPGKHV